MIPKLIFSDIDGTLIKPEGELTKVNIDTIKKLTKKNIPFILVSARSQEEMMDYYSQLELGTPIISYNGGFISKYQNGSFESVSSIFIEPNEPKIIYDIITTQFPTISLSLYSETKWYASKIDRGVQIEKDLTGLSPVILNVKEFIDSRAPIHKIMMIGEKDVIIEAEKVLKENKDLTSSIHKSGNIYLEVTNKKATKINAVKYVIENFYNIDPKEVMAIGDSYNDLEMLRYVGFGVAMGNAPQEIRKSVKYITDSNTNNGVAKAIEKLVLLTLEV